MSFKYPTIEARSKIGSIFGIRHLQVFMLFTGLGVGYALRVNLSVAIIAMTDRNATNSDFTVYDWSEKTKSLLLSSFFWGYIITQIPAGQLARTYGGKVMFLLSILISSLMALFTPLCAALGDWQLVCALRVLQGLSQGVLFPATHTIVSKWAPVEERGTLSTYSYMGTIFGTAIMLASSGVLACSPLGWPGIFYVSGGVGILWCFIFLIWGASTPSECKLITVEEKQLIESSLGKNEDKVEQFLTALKTPWMRFFTSVPFLVLIFVHCAHNWGFWTLLTEIPSYMKNILGMDIKSNALLSSLPYVAMLLLSFIFCTVATELSKRQYISLSTSRKLFNTIGQWIPMAALLALGYLGRDQATLAIVLLTIAVSINSASFLGFQVNHIDLSPNFAGVMMGITNCAANIMSIIAPLIVGFIVTNEKNPDQWRIIFFIAGGFYFLGNLLFISLGQTKIQTWNNIGKAEVSIDTKRNSVLIESQT